MTATSSARDIDDAMARYTVRLLLPHLRKGVLEMHREVTSAGELTYPLARTGQFARVFTITDDTRKKRAVRCFYTVPRAEYRKRYSTIDQFFHQHVPTITASFRFHDQGIK